MESCSLGSRRLSRGDALSKQECVDVRYSTKLPQGKNRRRVCALNDTKEELGALRGAARPHKNPGRVSVVTLNRREEAAA